ncbi:MAG: hypothetical protein KKH29_03970 [Candidatus Omnitrophica bacterium]|nr:hypothetical protein [Candidatus Omnitrophota bacterium]MBU4472644.1 hypothetical protein [Candidatus Omnitrophota bacterium]MCG2706733.1 hypothetical protein [Candidatus Omnitrophota bacterium]
MPVVPEKKALTLLEIIISTVIMSLVITGMANIFLAGKRHILHTRSRMTAGELGRRFLDPLQMDVRQDEWFTNGNCLTGDGSVGCDTTPWSPDGIVSYTPQYEISRLLVDAQNPLGRLRKVKLTVTWNELSP